MKKNTLIFFFFLLFSNVFCQSDYTFKKIVHLPFGGEVTSVRQLLDESYIMCGVFGGNPPSNLGGHFLMKLAKDGTTIWYKEFSTSAYFAFLDLTFDFNNNIYVSAWGTDSVGSTDLNMVIIKTDSTGSVLWSKSYGGVEPDQALSIDLTSDNNIIATGFSQSYATLSPGETSYTMKLDLNGNLLWNKFFIDSVYSNSYYVKEIYPNKYVKVGSNSFSVFDNNGNILTSKFFTYSDLLGLYSVTKFNNGGYLIAGTTGSFSGAGSLRPFLMALDQNYNFLWAKKYLPSISNTSEFYSINRTLDGNYITAFEPEGVNGRQKSMGMMKLDSNGVVIWGKLYEQNYFAYPNKLIEAKDGGYMEVGFIQKEMLDPAQPFIIKTNNFGIVNGCINDTIISSGFQNVTPVISTFGSVSSACTVNIISLSNITVTRLDSVYCVDSVPSTIGIEQYHINNDVIVYPNPVLSSTTFLLSTEFKKGTLTIFNSIGEKVETKNFSGMEVVFNRNKLPSGMYFYTIDSENKSITKGKLIFK